MFQIRNTRFEHGEVLPVLCRAPQSTPVVLPLIYTVLRRRHRAVNTIRHDTLVLKWLYEWGWDTFDRDVDDLISKGHISQVIDRLEQFAFWLRTGRITNKIAGRIGRSSKADDWLHPKTFNGYLHSIQLFLTWAAERYFNTSSVKELSQNISELKARIKANFDALYLGGATATDAKGLETNEVHIVLLMLHPSSHGNPFRQNAQIRNWIIFRLFWEAGPRRGELLKVKTTDIYEEGDKYYVAFRRLPDDPSEIRAIPPAQKTLPRIVSISRDLFLDMEKYIQTDRRPTRNGKRCAVGHQYLFTSERGAPLSLSALNYAFGVMQKVAFKNTTISLHPHLLRNTFCNNYLNWRIDQSQVELERALDELRHLCGWKLGSSMPQRYASKWMSAQANEHNQKRVTDAWNYIRKKVD
jgi:integrase